MVYVLFHQPNDILNCGRLAFPSLLFRWLKPLVPVRASDVPGKRIFLVHRTEIAVMIEGINDLTDSVRESGQTKLKRIYRILGEIDDRSISGQHPVPVFTGIVDDDYWDLE